MTIEQLIANANTMGGVIVAGLAGLSGVVGTGAFIAGKLGNNPGYVSWGKNGWLGMGVGLAAGAVYAIITNVSQRIAGG